VENADRNPQKFRAGDRVRVVGASHRDHGKVGVIVKLAVIENDQRGKPRASINCNGVYIFVSLPNLARVTEND
jgi:hypothetical protein